MSRCPGDGAAKFSAGPVHVYPLDRIRDAHRDMEEGRRTGKLVVRL
ncbi:zinc-binding dehydrogenase [Streptomyces uncialis]